MVRIRQHGPDRRLFDMNQFLADLPQFVQPDAWLVSVQECLGEGELEIEEETWQTPVLFAPQELASRYAHIYQTIDGSFVGLVGGTEVCRFNAVDSSFWEVTGPPALEEHLLSAYGAAD